MLKLDSQFIENAMEKGKCNNHPPCNFLKSVCLVEGPLPSHFAFECSSSELLHMSKLKTINEPASAKLLFVKGKLDR